MPHSARLPGQRKANARRQLDDTHRRLLARVALAATRGGGAYDLHEHLRVENTRDSWPLSLALQLTPVALPAA